MRSNYHFQPRLRHSWSMRLTLEAICSTSSSLVTRTLMPRRELVGIWTLEHTWKWSKVKNMVLMLRIGWCMDIPWNKQSPSRPNTHAHPSNLSRMAGSSYKPRRCEFSYIFTSTRLRIKLESERSWIAHMCTLLRISSPPSHIAPILIQRMSSELPHFTLFIMLLTIWTW